MIRDNLKDAGEIIETILNQPLTAQDPSKDITLLSAALSFEDEAPENSALQKALFCYLEYPDASQALLQELEILSNELKSR